MFKKTCIFNEFGFIKRASTGYPSGVREQTLPIPASLYDKGKKMSKSKE